MNLILWSGVILLLLGGAGSLWKGLRAHGSVHPLKRLDVQGGALGILGGSAKIAEAYWSTAAGIALMMAAAAISVMLIVRLWGRPSETTDT